MKKKINRKQKGYLMLTILFLLQIITWMVFASNDALSTLMQSSRELELHSQMLYKSRSILPVLLKNTSSLELCLTDIKKTQWSKKNEEWWKRHACVYSEEEMNYYYVVEDLESDACALIEGNNKIAHYYRLTLFAKSPLSFWHRSLLEAYLIYPDKNDNNNCQRDRRVVKMGVQSIGYL